MRNVSGYSENIERLGIKETFKTRRLSKVGLKAVIQVNKFLKANYWLNENKESVNRVK